MTKKQMVTFVESKGYIGTEKKLKKFEKHGNRVVVMWGDSRPSVLTWDQFRNSWIDEIETAYALEPDSYPIFKVTTAARYSW